MRPQMDQPPVEPYHGMEPTCEEDRRMLAQESAAIDVALRVAAILEEKGWTRRQLAERMNRPPEYVTAILGGKSNITLGTLADLARALDVELMVDFVKPP